MDAGFDLRRQGGRQKPISGMDAGLIFVVMEGGISTGKRQWRTRRFVFGSRLSIID
ncbi:MAG: hypothetical protein M3R20_05540 [Pseudomonadota bacterium]|nr:hypothetical protein [Pseudomonadota bacterium]